MTKNEILEALAAESGPVTPTALATELGVKANEITTPIKRMVENGEVAKNEAGEILITEKGKALIAPPPPSQADMGATEYDRFKFLGKKLGVTADLVDVATEHVWNGGDYHDLNWVWTALGEMGIRQDLKQRWWNAWRSFLKQAIPPELKEVVAPRESEETTPVKKPSFDYIIVDDEPVRVGAGLGDYGLQDAKDIIGIRALRGRFAGGSQAATPPPGQTDKISDILMALGPYLNKQTDVGMVKEILGDKMTILEQSIRGGMPQAQQPKSLVDQVGELIGLLGSLKEAGPALRSILGVPEQPGNPGSSSLLQIPGADGKPIILDPNALSSLINWTRFQGEEKRADEKQEMAKGLVQDFRMLAPDAIGALKATAEAYNRMAPSGRGAPRSEEAAESPAIQGICPNCQQHFSLSEVPTGDLPCPHCGAILGLAEPQVEGE